MTNGDTLLQGIDEQLKCEELELDLSEAAIIS